MPPRTEIGFAVPPGDDCGLTRPLGVSVPPEAKPSWDRESALAHLGGDEDLLAGLIVLLHTHGQEMRAAVGRALTAGDIEAAALAAHKLAGSVANLHAWPTRDAALDVERAAEGGDLHAARDAHVHLSAEFDRLLRSVTPPQSADDTPLEQG